MPELPPLGLVIFGLGVLILLYLFAKQETARRSGDRRRDEDDAWERRQRELDEWDRRQRDQDD